MMYEELPDWLKPGVTSYAKLSIYFENKTKILVSATSKSAFRGKTLSLLILDEFAFVGTGKTSTLAEEFWSSNYPTLSASKTSKVIIISTPNGLFNMFHRIWLGSETGKNEFANKKIDWRSVPGRDEEWAKKERENIGSDVLFQQEHGCEFIGSSSTLISPNVLETLLVSYIEPSFRELEDNFFIYEKPEENVLYVCGVDSALGTGGDDSVIQVLKIINTNPIKIKQVAIYYNNTIETHVFAEIVNRISLYYNNAYIMIENNAEAAAVINDLWYGFGNMNIISYAEAKTKKTIGIRATKSTKPKACINLKRLIEFGNLDLFDKKTIEQLSSFVEEKGKFFGKSLHDDCVTALYWGLFIIETQILDDVNLGKNIITEESEPWGLLTDFDSSVDDDFGWLNGLNFN